MKRQNVLRRFLMDNQGATILEFALVATVFFTLFLGIVEYGLIMFTKIAIESATQQVSRSGGINANVSGCSDSTCVVKTLIAQKTLGLINPQNVVITSSVVGSSAQGYPPEPDVCLDSPTVPYPASCVGPWVENNGTALYQAPSNNAGTSDDIVQIRVFYTWQVLFPLLKPLFPGGVEKMVSVTVVKNEPF